MKIAIAGTGYVGLVTGICLAEIGHEVVCIDKNETKIDLLKLGRPPFYENGLEALLKKNHNIQFTSDFKTAYKEAEIIFIAVETPENVDGSANLTYVYEVSKEIINSLQHDCTVVLKSTVPVGTSDEIEEFMKKNIHNNINVEVLSNPEFLSQGTAIKDTMEASRIIIGANSEEVANLLKQVYEPFNRPFVITSRSSAEMIKYASNDFLALKISFINDIANLCELVGANIEDVTKGMSFDERIGAKFLNAGVGYGGSCFPKDTKSLHWLSKDRGYELKTVRAAIEVNELQKTRLIQKAKKQFSSFNGIRVTVLGLTFKPGTDDLREAPSLNNIDILLNDGAIVTVYDPVGMDNVKKVYSNKITYAQTPESALQDSEVCFIFTEWDQIKQISPSQFKKNMKTPNVYDGRNCYRISDMTDSGVNYNSIGRS